MVNGTYDGSEYGNGHMSPTRSYLEGNNRSLLINENGMVETEPPHGSVMGSNGFILGKQQQQQQDGGPATGSGLVAAPHRTNWLPLGSTVVGHVEKTCHPSAAGCAQSLGGLRTDTSAGTMSGQGMSDTETKNGTVPSPTPTPPPITIHRARKTMSRPAVSPAQKVTSSQSQRGWR